MVLIKFTGNSFLVVNWEAYYKKHEKSPTNVGDRLHKFINEKIYLKFTGQYINFISHYGEISDWINDLSSIIGFLQQEDIPLENTTMAVSIDGEPKIMVINQSGLYIINVSDDASTTTEFFPLGNKVKLI